MSEQEIRAFEMIANEELKIEGYEIQNNLTRDQVLIHHQMIKIFDVFKRYFNPVYNRNHINYLTILLRRLLNNNV